MALGKMSKADIKKFRDYEAKLKAHLDAIGQFEKVIVTSQKSLDGVLAKANAEYAKALVTLDAFAAWLAGIATDQRDEYEEKASESERWAESDRAGQVESWVDALETASNIEEVPRTLVLAMDDSSWYAGVTKMPESIWDIEDAEPQGGMPTSFPAYFQPGFDYWGLKDIVDSLDSVPVEEGADHY